jgi:hypothetical protein
MRTSSERCREWDAQFAQKKPKEINYLMIGKNSNKEEAFKDSQGV